MTPGFTDLYRYPQEPSVLEKYGKSFHHRLQNAGEIEYIVWAITFAPVTDALRTR